MVTGLTSHFGRGLANGTLVPPVAILAASPRITNRLSSVAYYPARLQPVSSLAESVPWPRVAARRNLSPCRQVVHDHAPTLTSRLNVMQGLIIITVPLFYSFHFSYFLCRAPNQGCLGD
ncbi:hypothetical protein M6B38_351250 [Iris pallida]|uniref:Uncharacterized protein n=1 Tax=Iris pallida TaxID=29817 RepID=A0AAX6GPN8_IRIPA|nr:hypothetical protein M6B38_351250 [Iris pallida]